MGVGFEFICHDCKTRYGLGYGPYSGWVPPCLSTEEFDSFATYHPEIAKFERNRRMYRAINIHKGHDFEYLSDDNPDYEGLGLKAKDYTVEKLGD